MKVVVVAVLKECGARSNGLGGWISHAGGSGGCYVSVVTEAAGSGRQQLFRQGQWQPWKKMADGRI